MRLSFQFLSFFFFFNDTATTEIYTLSLHDALPICTLQNSQCSLNGAGSSVSGTDNNLTVNVALTFKGPFGGAKNIDRKSTRLNSSHQIISYAVFCLKKKKKQNHTIHILPHTKRQHH